MDINHFLNGHLKEFKKFHAAVISIDIVKSRSLAGSDDEKGKN